MQNFQRGYDSGARPLKGIDFHHVGKITSSKDCECRDKGLRRNPEWCTGGTADVELEAWQEEVGQLGRGPLCHTKEFGCYVAGNGESSGILRRVAT